MNPIDKVLDWFDDGDKWMKGELVNSRGNRACLVGGLMLMAELDMNQADDVELMEYLPCTTTIAEVIKEQFPDRIPGVMSNNVDPLCQCNQCEESRNSVTTVIFNFNDNTATTYDDIRLVLEKARVIEQEKE